MPSSRSEQLGAHHDVADEMRPSLRAAASGRRCGRCRSAGRSPARAGCAASAAAEGRGEPIEETQPEFTAAVYSRCPVADSATALPRSAARRQDDGAADADTALRRRCAGSRAAGMPSVTSRPSSSDGDRRVVRRDIGDLQLRAGLEAVLLIEGHQSWSSSAVLVDAVDGPLFAGTGRRERARLRPRSRGRCPGRGCRAGRSSGCRARP